MLLLVFLQVGLVRPQTVHTWHNVSSNGMAACQLSDIYETDFVFINVQMQPISTFSVDAQTVFVYGLQLGNDTDFNMLYSLVCTVQNNQTSQSPKVAFVVGANGPADPNINVLNYYGAYGKYQVVPGSGENFFLLF